MSTVPYEQQKVHRQIILLLHGRPVGVMVSCLRFLMNSKNNTNIIIITREAGLTPCEPSISYGVYGLLLGNGQKET